ncbi:MAG: hypothetical protein AB1815_02055 [Bacillota bacterium]
MSQNNLWSLPDLTLITVWPVILFTIHAPSEFPDAFITELIRPKTPASVGGGFQKAVKSSMNSAFRMILCRRLYSFEYCRYEGTPYVD